MTQNAKSGPPKWLLILALPLSLSLAHAASAQGETDAERPFNTDRPDVTESPYTVEAGRFQVELSFVEYTRDAGGSTRTNALAVLPSNLKVGLRSNLDLQLVLNPYQSVRTHGGRASARSSGVGATELRAKLNLWGNDGGRTAFGVMPFVRFPTGSEGLRERHLSGGLILPLAVQDLPGGFDLGTMAELDVSREPGASSLDFVHSVTCGHDLFKDRLRGYIEYVGVAPLRSGHPYLAYFDSGATFAVSSGVQLDAGINLALSREAEDFTLFAGVSFRH
jgi:hypothetical protein